MCTMQAQLSTAYQPDMPESAIASGCINFVLSPEAIAEELVRIAHEEAQPTPTAGAPLTRDEVSDCHAHRAAGGSVLS